MLKLINKLFNKQKYSIQSRVICHKCGNPATLCITGYITCDKCGLVNLFEKK